MNKQSPADRLLAAELASYKCVCGGYHIEQPIQYELCRFDRMTPSEQADYRAKGFSILSPDNVEVLPSDTRITPRDR